jgi:hypothetical protein
MANYTQQRKFNLTCSDCRIWSPFHITWLNKRGGFDKYSFRLKSTTKLDIEKKEWSRFVSRLQPDNTWGYEIGDRGRTNYYSKSLYSYTALSTWQTQQEHNWLTEIFDSVEVYYILSNQNGGVVTPVYVPIIVLNQSIDIKSKRGLTDKLLSYTIEFTMAYDINNQNG